MFCHKCGAELTDEAIFCQRCGEKVLDEDMFQQSENIDKKQRSVETTRLSADQPQNISDNKVKTKKSKKKLSLLGIIFAAIFLVIFIATNWEGKADYIASVKAHTPFAASQNLPYTYEEVLNKFMDTLEWKVHEDGEIHYIDVSGIVKGIDRECKLTIKVLPNPDVPNGILIQPELVTIARDLKLKDNDAIGFLIAMFSAYDENYSDLSKLLVLMDLLEAKGEIKLSETYINEEEGISFKYPVSWLPVSEMEDAVENDPGITVVGLVNTLMPFQSFILVSKFPDNLMAEYLFIDNDEFAANFSDEISVIDTSITELDGIVVREISYIDSEDRYTQSYFYVVGTDLYRVDLACEEFYKEKFEKIFDAVMDSYSVDTLMTTNPDMNTDLTQSDTAGNNAASVDNICFNDIPVSDLLNSSAMELVQRFGGSYYADGEGRISYDEIEFYMLDDETVEYIWSFSLECFSINGNALNVNDEGVIYKDEIIELLGTVYEDESLSSGYYMTYYYPTYSISFGVNKFSEVSDIRIYNLATGNSDYSGNVSGTYQEPIENYWKLSGSYSDSTGSLTLSLSIYSSQEEGEIEIGSADIYASNGQHYVGSVTPVEKNVYKIATDTGEEVLLVEEDYGDIIMLQLYPKFRKKL